MKRWRRDAVLRGFSDESRRWFKISVTEMLKQVVSPGEDVYFLKASGNFFLFASNTSQVVIAVNFVSKTVKKIPPCPLGPRGTSSWRRSGMKVVACPDESGSDHFRFLFAELVENRPVLFEYRSDSNTWKSRQARESVEGRDWSRVGSDWVFLNVSNGPYGSVVVAVGSDEELVVLRPRFDGGRRRRRAVGFTRVNAMDWLHVYGDGYMALVRSCGASEMKRKVSGVELWGMCRNGRRWEFVSEVPSEIMEKISKGYGVMMGCVEERDGIIRVALISNSEGVWDIVWLSYDMIRGGGQWSWVPLPDCKMINGSNMAGITFSSGLTLS